MKIVIVFSRAFLVIFFEGDYRHKKREKLYEYLKMSREFIPKEMVPKVKPDPDG